MEITNNEDAKSNKSAFAFSIVVIARNESQSLPRLFASCKSFLDSGGELIVMDTGSTDSTLEIARQTAGVKIFEAGTKFAFALTKNQVKKINATFVVPGDKALVEKDQRVFHFGNARNAADGFASNDMILQVDASDVFEAFDFEQLDAVLRAGPVKRFQYSLTVNDIELLVRRFYNRKQDRWYGCVHETLTEQTSYSSSELHVCSKQLLSLRHIRNNEKSRHYHAGLALDLLQHPDEPRYAHYLGCELHDRAQWKSAIRLLEQVGDSVMALPGVRSESLCFAGKCYEKLNQVDKALYTYWKGFEIDPTRRECLLRIADIHALRKDYQKVVCYVRAVLGIPRTPSKFAESTEHYGWRPHKMLYDALRSLGRDQEAKQEYKLLERVVQSGLSWREELSLTSLSLSLAPAPAKTKVHHTETKRGDAVDAVDEVEQESTEPESACDCAQCRRERQRSKSCS